MNYQALDDKTLKTFDLKKSFLSYVKIAVKREREVSKRSERKVKTK